MKKLMEMAIKSNVNIEYDSPEFEQIKKNIDQVIKNQLGPKYNELSFQCNCTKLKNPNTNEYSIFVKVYGWPKNNIEEENFYLNTSVSKSDFSTPIMKSKVQSDVENINNQILVLKAALKEVDEKIDYYLGKDVTKPVIISLLNKHTKRKKEIETQLAAKKKQLEYIKSEFLYKDDKKDGKNEN